MDKEKLGLLGIDYEAAIKRFAGNELLYEKYLNKFPEDEHLAAAEAALKEGNYEEVLAQIHALKGMTGTMGMNDTCEKCQIVMAAIRGNQLDDLALQMEEVHGSYEKVMTYYQE